MTHLADTDHRRAELTVQGSDLRMFVAALGSRPSDNPLAQFFREVSSLRTLQEISRGTRLDSADAAAAVPGLPGAARDTGGIRI